MKGSENPIFFRPADGWVGDVIPYFWGGQFWLFYLHATRVNGFDSGTSWYAVRTTDFVHFEELGEVLPQGEPTDDDWNCYTGSVLFAKGTHHLFYTAFNPKLIDPETGVPSQVVEYSMLVATRHRSGPERRRGAIARAVSTDLATWEFVEPLLDGRFYMHECPDLFRLDEFWYLVFSEFPERFDTRYRYARTPVGPWRAPAEDAFDGRGMYAAKTATDGTHNYLFGWIPTKQGLRDDGQWEWAGDLVVHELVQRSDGTLATKLPGHIRRAFTEPAETGPVRKQAGVWRQTEGEWQCNAGSTTAQLELGAVPDRCLLRLDIEFDAAVSECGLILHAHPDPETGYYLRLEPPRGRVVLDTWRTVNRTPHGWQDGGAANHSISSQRSIHLAPGVKHNLDVLIDGSIGVAYVDQEVALSFRMYDRNSGSLALFVADGSATFSSINISNPMRRESCPEHESTPRPYAEPQSA